MICSKKGQGWWDKKGQEWVRVQYQKDRQLGRLQDIWNQKG